MLYEHAKLLRAGAKAGDDGSRAAALLDESARLCEELGMPGVLERVSALAEPATRVPPPPAPQAVFRREGELWTIIFGGTTCRITDMKGLRYIAFLLASPGREVHALELAQAGEGLAPRSARSGGDGLRPSTAGAAPLLDTAAKDAYRRRLTELGEDLQEARDWQDTERIARIEDEIDALTGELARAAGLGGRDRRLPSPAERARVSVTKAIRTAIRAIDRHDRALGEHLAAAIRTGRFCSYAPPGERPPRWTF